MHLLANQYGWYYAYSCVDIIMHIGGGIWVAWAAYAYMHRLRGYLALPRLVQALGVLCFVALVGVLWEFLEAGADAWRLHASGMPWAGVPGAFGLYPYDLRWDTLLDLFNDLVGGTIVAIFAGIHTKAMKRWQ